MREADLARLTVPYPEDDAFDRDSAPDIALGVAAPNWSALTATIIEDLATDPPYGIGWWAPYPGTSRRILISDQLYCCTASVRDNLVEAGIHWLEFLDYSERESDRMVDAVQVENGQLVVRAPKPRNVLDDLGAQLVRVHVVGVVRALAGALDCLAGTVIGVAALPSKILKADFGTTRNVLRQIRNVEADTVGKQRQVAFAESFEAAIRDAGPDGWLEWVLALRNMLIHRGRRLEVGQFVPREPVIYDARGRAIPRVRVVTQLPLDPGRSDVEVLLDPNVTPVLTEDQRQTLEGLINSVRSLVSGVGSDLAALWQWRRHHPDGLEQPATQWPGGASTESTGFNGYAPGTFRYQPSQMMTHPVVVRRLRAGALDDRARPQWQNFD